MRSTKETHDALSAKEKEAEDLIRQLQAELARCVERVAVVEEWVGVACSLRGGEEIRCPFVWWEGREMACLVWRLVVEGTVFIAPGPRLRF